MRPASTRQWQEAVDAAHLCVMLEIAMLYGLLKSGVEVDTQACLDILEDGRIQGIHPRQEREAQVLRQLLVDADEVARRRGAPGLCDAIDNSGQAYPSACGSALIEYLKSNGVKSILSLNDARG